MPAPLSYARTLMPAPLCPHPCARTLVPAARTSEARRRVMCGVSVSLACGGAFQAARDARTPFLAVLLAGAPATPQPSVLNTQLDPLKP
jgi:hypothetical protein